LPAGHSLPRRARKGSMRTARKAGTALAKRNQRQSQGGSEERQRIGGAYADNCPARNRLTARNPAVPAARATAAAPSQKTCKGGLPLAMRSPTSGVRRSARYNITPYIPTAARRRASPAKIARSAMVKRLCQQRV